MTTAIAVEAASVTGSIPVADGVERVHAVLDRVDAGEVGEVRGPEVAEVDRAIARLEGLKLRLVAAAHRQGAAQRAGMSGTGAWLAACTRSWGAKAAADVSLATALDQALPLTRAALLDGRLGTAHAGVIAGTVSRLPERLTAAEREKVEAALVAQARVIDPARLRRSARRALAAAERSARETLEHEDAELRSEEERARRRVRLTLHDNLDGTVTGHFTVPTLAGAILRKTLQQLVSPRRHRSRPDDDRTGSARPGEQRHPPSVVPPRGSHPTDWAHEYGRAFVELLEHLPTDRLSGKVAATVLVTIDHERLREGLGSARLDTGHDLSAGEARRAACAAGILPAVLDGGSLPLDLGRAKRFFTEAQRVALAAAYDTCAADGCDRPYAWCELHHEDPWSRGGRSDLHLAVPLCGTDHTRVHDPRHEHRIIADTAGRKRVTFHRRT